VRILHDERTPESAAAAVASVFEGVNATRKRGADAEMRRTTAIQQRQLRRVVQQQQLSAPSPHQH